MTVVSCNVKHYCPTLCAQDFIITAEHQQQQVGRFAAELVGCLHVISPCYMCYQSPAFTA